MFFVLQYVSYSGIIITREGDFMDKNRDLINDLPYVQLNRIARNDIDYSKNIFFHKNINYLKESKHLSQENIGNIVGKERSVVSLWERNERNPSMEDLIKLSNYFQVSIDDLTKRDLKMESLKQYTIDTESDSKIPVFERISADTFVTGIKDVVGWEEIPRNWLSEHRNYFCLKITGDSMLPNYLDGDIVIFQKDNDYDNGKDCVVIVGNNDAMFKRIIKQPNGILLQSLNSNYQTDYYNDNEIKELPVVILGIAKEIRRRVGGE